MTEVESMRTIASRWKREGREYRPQELIDEWKRQGREFLRSCESAILEADPDSEIAAQIRDHRSAGNYTTQG